VNDAEAAPALVRAASGLTVAAAFRMQVVLRGDAPALQEGERTLSYRQLNERSARLAYLLAARGVARGERVAILSENRGEYLELFLAAARLGAIVACQNWRLADAELAHCIRLASPRLVIVSPRHAPTLARIEHGVPVTLRLDDAFEFALAAADPAAAPEAAEAEDGLVILYTSGTTGLPKGALISHRAMVARSMVAAADWGCGAEDAFVAWTPLFHMGATDQALASLVQGGKVIVMDGFQPAALAEIACRERIGHLTVVPGVIDRLIAELRRLAARPARVRVIGVMPDLVPPHQLAELTGLVGAPYGNTFGSTETGMPPASRGLIPPGVAPSRFAKQQSSFCAVRLVDPDDREVPDGEPGEMTLRGPTLFSGYWGAHAVNAEEFRGGWFHMGDVFRRNPDGTLDFVDRRKYLIKSGGENIYPAEIERVILALPGIADAVVVRRADARWGEVPVAFVVRRDETLSREAILAACRAAIAGYKQPKDVIFLAEGDLPRSTSGKIQRHLLERRLAQGGAGGR
jgi:acyl-CoA synthetase (AMP-forming)/AMP-acid ligase II